MDLQERYADLIDRAESLEKERVTLDSELMPHVREWTAFCAEFTDALGVDRVAFWAKVPGGWPAGARLDERGRYSFDYRLVIDPDEAPNARLGFTLRGEDYDGDTHEFRLPAGWLTDPEAVKAEHSERWRGYYDTHLRKAAEAREAAELAEYERLREKFGEANPSQS